MYDEKTPLKLSDIEVLYEYGASKALKELKKYHESQSGVTPTPVPPTPEKNWEYIWNEETWNESYANGGLKRYYEWCDGGATAPYKEDLWNTVENRPANWNDTLKDEEGNPVVGEDGYYTYLNCERCWLGALNAPGAKYPWGVVTPPIPFTGIIKFVYDKNNVAYPWGDSVREFGRGFGCASVPTVYGDEYLLVDGVSSFEPEKLEVSFIEV